MTTYRVGAAGATVLDGSGAVVGRLPPGYTVVEGVVETRPPHVPEIPERVHDGKRIRGYADKRISGYADTHLGTPD